VNDNNFLNKYYLYKFVDTHPELAEITFTGLKFLSDEILTA
jgi:hypothetical protein